MPWEKPTWLHPALTRRQEDEEHLTLRPDIWSFLDATCSKVSSRKGGHHHFPDSMRILCFKFKVSNYLVINNLKQIGFMQSKKQRTNTGPSYSYSPIEFFFFKKNQNELEVLPLKYFHDASWHLTTFSLLQRYTSAQNFRPQQPCLHPRNTNSNSCFHIHLHLQLLARELMENLGSNSILNQLIVHISHGFQTRRIPFFLCELRQARRSQINFFVSRCSFHLRLSEMIYNFFIRIPNFNSCNHLGLKVRAIWFLGDAKSGELKRLEVENGEFRIEPDVK